MSGIENESDIYNSQDPVDFPETNVEHDDSLSGSGSEADPLELNVQHDDSLSGSGSENDPLKATNIIYITATKELDNSLTCDKTFNEIETIINDGKQFPIVNFTQKTSFGNYLYKLYYHGFDNNDDIKKYKFASCDNQHENNVNGYITSFHITNESINNLYFKNIRVIEEIQHDNSLSGDGSTANKLKLNVQHDESLIGSGAENDYLKLNYMFRVDATGASTIYDVIASVNKTDQGNSSVEVEFSVQSWDLATEICNYIVRLNSRNNTFNIKTVCFPNKSNKCSVYYFERDEKAYIALKKDPFSTDSIILLKNISQGSSFKHFERVSSIPETLTESTYQIIV